MNQSVTKVFVEQPLASPGTSKYDYPTPFFLSTLVLEVSLAMAWDFCRRMIETT